AGLADTDYATIPDADVRLHDPPTIDDNRIRVHEAERAQRAGGRRRLAHAVTDDLAAAELGLFTRHCQIARDLDQQIRIGQANAITRRRSVQIVVLSARNLHTKPFPEGCG